MRVWVLALFTVCCGMLHAYDVEVDGVYYGFFGTRRAYVTHPGEWSIVDAQPAAAYTGEIIIPETITYNGRTYTVVSVGASAFAGCDGLTAVQLPSSVRAISGCAFLGCTSLRQVSVPATIQAFSSCAFMGCTSLQQVTLPRHTEMIESLALYCCASLTSLALPHTVRAISQGALEHLPAMTDLYCFSSVPPVAEHGAFTPADQQRCILHVPADALHLYQESPLWSDFCRIVALTDEDYTGHNYRRGDINDDGSIDVEDLHLLRRLIVSLPDDAAVRWAADVNGDGKVNAIDYVTLAREQSGKR